MMACGEGHHEDVVRAFFRLKVADIGHLLIRVGDVTRRVAEGHGWNATEVLSEANRIVLVSDYGSFVDMTVADNMGCV